MDANPHPYKPSAQMSAPLPPQPYASGLYQPSSLVGLLARMRVMPDSKAPAKKDPPINEGIISTIESLGAKKIGDPKTTDRILEFSLEGHTVVVIVGTRYNYVEHYHRCCCITWKHLVCDLGEKDINGAKPDIVLLPFPPILISSEPNKRMSPFILSRWNGCNNAPKVISTAIECIRGEGSCR